MELDAKVEVARAAAERSQLDKVLPMVIRASMAEGETRLGKQMLASIVKKHIGVSLDFGEDNTENPPLSIQPAPPPEGDPLDLGEDNTEVPPPSIQPTPPPEGDPTDETKTGG